MRDAHTLSRALNPIARVVCCIACILGFPCLSLADGVPLATYGITVSVGTAPPQTIINTVVPNTVAQVTTSGATQGGTYAGTASASTFTPILVHVQGEADAQETGSLTSFGEGSTIIYYFQVKEMAPAPVDVVPLLIDSNVEADAGATGTGEGNAAADFIISDLNISHLETATCNAISCKPSSSMSFSDSANAMAGQNIKVQIVATGDAGAIGAPDCCGGHATFQAITDPTIQIDPSFAFADDFTLVFSANLTSPAGTPEPPSIALFATGLLALMTGLRSNAMRRRF